MFAPLYALRWRELHLTLRNTRNTFARQHPLAVIEAVLRGAWPALPPEQGWFFRPRQPTGSRVRLGHEWAVAAVFPGKSPAEVDALAGQLQAYLADPRHHFARSQLKPVVERSLAQIEAETRALDEAARTELCLDFISPLAFTPAEPSRRWLLRLPDLFAGLAARVEFLWGVRLPVAEAPLEGLELLPSCWDYVEHGRPSKSKGGTQYLNGCVGPLYLKGDSRFWLPLLRLGSALNVSAPGGGRGRRQTFGCGAYRLDDRRPYFTAALKNPELWRNALEELAAEHSEPDPVLHPLDREALIHELMREVESGQWQPQPARVFALNKKGSTPGEVKTRQVALFPARDRLVHRVLTRLLTPAWDRLFEACSQGFRPGRSVATAKQSVLKHLRAGCQWALEADAAEFFDTVDWGLLDIQLSRALPVADAGVAELIRRIARTALVMQGQPVARERGLPQGCALSPLLANLYLDPFDEAAVRAGLRLVRYADDFLVMCQDPAEAKAAQITVQRLLAERKLELQPDKLAITSVAGGFEFLGLRFAPELEAEFVEKSLLRRPAYVLADYSYIGAEAETLVCRAKGEPLSQLPLRRLGELIVYGTHAISTELLARCARQNIPVSFCGAAGHPVASLHPDNREHYDLLGRHYARRHRMSEAEVARLAASLVAAKLANYEGWFRQTAQGRGVAEGFQEIMGKIGAAASVAELLGWEGGGAKTAFRFINQQVRNPDFASGERLPRAKQDRWNSLLDFLYTRVFARLNALLRARGLNPYLGFLHSPLDAYESLVADLQEPFRARCDRWALRLVNLGTVTANDFAPHPRGGIRLTGEAVARLLELWERELDREFAGESGTWRDLLYAQVCAVEEWARGAEPLRFYRAARLAKAGQTDPANPG
jgi:group II intron reverse transcriptase/maturase/CRISPR-associated endonuclease Cas1